MTGWAWARYQARSLVAELLIRAALKVDPTRDVGVLRAYQDLAAAKVRQIESEELGR